MWRLQVYLFIIFHVQLISQGVTLLFFFAEKKKRSKKRKEFAFHLYYTANASHEVLPCYILTSPMNLRQHRTKSVWRLCTPSACKFPVIFHKNACEYIKYSLRFLFHLTENLTTHLSHNLCARATAFTFLKNSSKIEIWE